MTDKSELLEAYSAACRNAEGVRGEVCLHASDWMKLGDAIRALAAQPSDYELLREAREDTAHDDVVEALGGYQAVFNAIAAAVANTSLRREGGVNISVRAFASSIKAKASETRIDTALATTKQPDNELADAADSEPSGEATQ